MSTKDFAPLSSSKKRSYLSSLLSDDLVIEILECLLVKSLLQFRCVSKTWYNMIKSPAFIDNYSRKKQKKDFLLVLRHPKKQPKTTGQELLLSFNDLESNLNKNRPSLSILSLLHSGMPDRYSSLLGPCNGLVLIVHHNSITICNPALREIKLLKVPECEHKFSYPPYLIDYAHQWGFGSTCINNFKVVYLSCIVYAPDNGTEQTFIEANLYTSGTNSWRKIDNTFKEVRFPHGLGDSQVFLNGACHWNVKPVNHLYINAILALNINTELFARLEYPDSLRGVKDRHPCLMVLNECLAVFRYTIHSGYRELFEIWMMKEYGVKESWTKQCVLGPHFVRRPLCFWENEESVLIESGEGQLVSCSVYTNKITKLPINAV